MTRLQTLLKIYWRSVTRDLRFTQSLKGSELGQSWSNSTLLKGLSPFYREKWTVSKTAVHLFSNHSLCWLSWQFTVYSLQANVAWHLGVRCSLTIRWLEVGVVNKEILSFLQFRFVLPLKELSNVQAWYEWQGSYCTKIKLFQDWKTYKFPKIQLVV